MIESVVRVFEEVEKIRRGWDSKLSHLEKNRRCLDCGKDWMPKKFEPCPECGSANTRLLKQRRECRDCGHRWKPSGLGVCPHCGSGNSEPNPKDDPYIREVALPRLRAEEDFYEKQLKEMVTGHPAWPWAEEVQGAGLTTIGRIIARTDIHRMDTVSKMWAHCGWGLEADGTRQRKRAGQALNYDAQLQATCTVLGETLLKQRDSYYEYYLRQKKAHSNLPPGHCHNRAFRHMIKLFLSHFWQTWREAERLSAPLPYAFGILHHLEGHLITPWDMVKQPPEPVLQKVTEEASQ